MAIAGDYVQLGRDVPKGVRDGFFTAFQRLNMLIARVDTIEGKPTPVVPSMHQIRSALQAKGTAPLNVQGLPGGAAQVSVGGVPTSTSLIAYGTYAKIPPVTASDNGKLYYATDQHSLYIVEGGVWKLVSGGSSERRRVTAQFDKVNATLANVTGLSVDVGAGQSYRFEAVLFVDASLVGGSLFAIAGTATATAIIYEIILVDNATNANTITSRQVAMAGSAGQAGTLAGCAVIRGTITVNAGGTLTVQFAQNVANGTSSVLVGSSFAVDVIP